MDEKPSLAQIDVTLSLDWPRSRANNELLGAARELRALLADAEAELAKKDAEIAETREEALPFIATYAARYAKSHGLPDGHLQPLHYDILARFGARMDSFTRHDEANGEAS